LGMLCVTIDNGVEKADEIASMTGRIWVGLVIEVGAC
jgi:hypothetical protein